MITLLGSVPVERRPRIRYFYHNLSAFCSPFPPYTSTIAATFCTTGDLAGEKEIRSSVVMKDVEMKQKTYWVCQCNASKEPKSAFIQHVLCYSQFTRGQARLLARFSSKRMHVLVVLKFDVLMNRQCTKTPESTSQRSQR